jgi:hypothetical protein
VEFIKAYQVKIIIVILILFIVWPKSDEVQLLTPNDAIRLAAEVAENRPSIADGNYQLFIQATGKQKGHVYLNSEKDYRDQRNVSINLMPQVLNGLKHKYKQEPLEFFHGKMIQVKGEPRRVKIWFYYEGKSNGMYYYQTHIVVSDVDQIKVVELKN